MTYKFKVWKYCVSCDKGTTVETVNAMNVSSIVKADYLCSECSLNSEDNFGSRTSLERLMKPDRRKKYELVVGNL